MIADLLIIVACIVGLWVGAGWIIQGASRLARQLGLSELVIGLTVVAAGTSAPEFAVTIVAAIQGSGDISVGNVIGSNIFNLGFILGGVALAGALTTTPLLVRRDGSMLIGTTLLLLFFLRDLALSRVEGIILMLVLVSYLVLLFRLGEAPAEGELPAGEFTWLDVPRLLVGLVVIGASGHFLVESASEVARVFGLSEWVIGVTIVAAGTSAPELATSLFALARGRHGLSIGNIIGSDIYNLLGVLGLASALRPMQVDGDALGSVVVLVGMVSLTVLMMRTGWQLSRAEGGLLVSINLVRWVADFMGR